MESRHDTENAERILYNMTPQQLVRLGQGYYPYRARSQSSRFFMRTRNRSKHSTARDPLQWFSEIVENKVPGWKRSQLKVCSSAYVIPNDMSWLFQRQIYNAIIFNRIISCFFSGRRVQTSLQSGRSWRRKWMRGFLSWCRSQHFYSRTSGTILFVPRRGNREQFSLNEGEIVLPSVSNAIMKSQVQFALFLSLKTLSYFSSIFSHFTTELNIHYLPSVHWFIKFTFLAFPTQ